MNKYIKMNDNKKYLSLGNLFNIIKKYSSNINTAIQVELFYAIFNVDNINKTTINNYLTGYRPISLEYKKIYYDLLEEYKENNNIFLDIILKIISILDEKIYLKDNKILNLINNNKRLNLVLKDLIKLSKEDINISEEFIEYLESNNTYESFIRILFYTVLENKQPIYYEKINNNFNNEELNEYLKINLYEGISYINSLINLGKKNNMYANAELGSLEYSGIINGTTDYKKCYNYYLKAAKKNHPKACWMVANLMLTRRVECNFKLAWKYLNKAVELGSVAALNTMGNCYKNGNTPDNKKDKDKALEYYLKASEYGYAYAFNNIGLIYEEENNIEESIKYFKISADLFNSWALNKVGEYYIDNNDLKAAYYYLKKAIDCPINERSKKAYYNLAKYYYSIGNKDLKIKQNKEKAEKYFELSK